MEVLQGPPSSPVWSRRRPPRTQQDPGPRHFRVTKPASWVLNLENDPHEHSLGKKNTSRHKPAAPKQAPNPIPGLRVSKQCSPTRGFWCVSEPIPL